jgi:hypothetical protein
VTLTIDVPDAEPARVRAFVLDTPSPDTPSNEFIGIMGDRAIVRQFDPLGYATTLSETATSGSLIAKADPAAMREGRVIGPDADSVSVVNLLAQLPQRASMWETDTFTLPAPSGRDFYLFFQFNNQDGQLIQRINALPAAAQIPDVLVRVPESDGRLSGFVGKKDDVSNFWLTAVRVDGEYMIVLAVAADGRFQWGDGTADPSDPEQDLPVAPGEYYILNSPSTGTAWSLLAPLTAIYTDTAQQERDALVRMTIHADQRTVVEWNAEAITSTTDDLVNTVLFTP